MTKAYKLFRIRKNSPGVLFPLYVLADEPLEMNEWLIAKEGIRLPNNKVHSKLGPLAFRPLYECSYKGRYMNPFFIRTIKKHFEDKGICS